MRILVLAVVYFAAASLGLAMAFEAAQVTVIWPPTGIALAAVLLLGYRIWPGIALGAFLVNIMVEEPAAVALGVAAGNTLEALAGAWMLRRSGFDRRLSRLRDVLSLVIFSAVLSTMVSATIGVTSLCLGGVQPWESYGLLWRIWWIGDAVGALIIAPLLLAWSGGYGSLRQYNMAEAGMLVAGLLVICQVIFTVPATYHNAFIYVVFPFIIWAALRFKQHGVTVVTLLAGAIAIWATLHDAGPFAGSSVEHSLMLLQIFMGVAAVTGLLLSAAIAEQKEAVESKARLGERLRLMIDSALDAVIAMDQEGNIVEWNKQSEAVFGWSLQEATGKPMAELIIPPEQRAAHFQGIRRFLQTGAGPLLNKRVEMTAMNRRGERFPVELTISAQQLQGRYYFTSFLRDISEHKRAEEALRLADRRKNEFLATLAHELRNPLAPIVGAVQVLQLPRTGATQRKEACSIIARQAQHMTRLVDDLLDISRITHGKIELHKERTALADIIHSAVETAKPLIESRGHALTIEPMVEPLWLDADPVRLAQVFANLLSNAAKYTPPGGRIELAATADNSTMAIAVRDTGVGIPEVMLEKIFDMFTQVDSSIERTQGGLGIGLTLVKNLVGMHGGRIEARNRSESRGSEFIVHLPRVASIQPLVAPTPADPPSAAARRFRVLVVEDSAALARTLDWMLEALGHEVRIAHDGKKALAAAYEYLPDVVMLDIGLPGMNGYEVCRQLRILPELKDSIFIAQTGWGQPEHRARSQAAGFDYHLVKPVDITALENLFLSLSTRQAA